MRTHIRLLALSTSLLVIGSAVAFRPASLGHRHGHDSNTIPEIVTPSPATISVGGQTTITVTMNENTTSNTVVYLSSGDPALTVPAYVTVLSGNNSAQFTATASGGRPRNRALSRQGDAVTVTASANGSQAQGTVTVDE